MKIVSCHIENYGKISQTDFEFNKDITAFNWDNGSGKTTLVSFIKAMLYGLSSTKINSKTFDDRQHFFPFNYGKFGGSVTLAAGDDEYRIERIFDKKSAAADSVKVYKNGTLAEGFTADIGKRLLGIDEDTFMKTSFFNSSDTEICTPAGIEAHINNYEEGINAKKVLDEQIKKLKPERGKSGKIYECQEEVRKLREETSDLKQKSASLELLYDERNEIQAELALNESRLKECIFTAGRQHEMNVLQNMFIGGVPTDEDFEKINNYIKTIKKIEEDNDKIKNEFDVVLKKSKRTKLLLTVNAFMIITAAVLLMVGQMITAVITVLASGVMALYLCISAKKIKTVNELSEQRRKNNLRCDFCLQEIYDFVSQYVSVRDDTDLVKEVEKIKMAAEKYSKIKEIKYDADYKEIEGNIKRLKGELAALDRQIIKNETEIESFDDKADRLEKQEALLEEYKNQLFIIEAAKSAILEAENNLKNKYSNPIKENFGKYAGMIEEATGEKIMMDDKYNVYFVEAGERQNHKHLSQGQQSMLAFCFKMALLDSIYAEEKPFVLLDDPFVNLDGENMSKMAKVIKKVSNDRQIIYFCCHDSRNVL